MAWLAVDKKGAEYIYEKKPFRLNVSMWIPSKDSNDECVLLPLGSIEKLIGRKLTWDDEPVELTE